MRRLAETIPPLRKERNVPLPVAQAFGLFTERMTTWWPLATHSLGHDPNAVLQFEPRVGGAIIETLGEQSWVWGVVLAWDPPYRVSFSWHPTEDPVASSIVDVRFAADGERASVLTLEHRGFEEHGEPGHAMRANYDPGWDAVLANLVDAAT